MNRASTLSFVLLMLLNATIVFGWLGCDSDREGGGCHLFCPCEGDMTCEAGHQVCRKPGQSGDPCHATRPCASGLSCQPGVHRCYHTPRDLGEPCVAGHSCRSGQFCAPGEHVCKQWRAQGQTCDSKYLVCINSDRYCVNGICEL